MTQPTKRKTDRTHVLFTIGAIVLALIAILDARAQYYTSKALKAEIAILREDIKGNTAISTSNTAAVFELRNTTNSDIANINYQLDFVYRDIEDLQSDVAEEVCEALGYLPP